MRPIMAAAGLAAITACTGCDGRHRAAPSSGPSHEEPHAGPAIAVLDLSDGVPEQSPTGLLGLSPKGASFVDLAREVDRLGHDKDVRGVLVRLGTARVGLARSQEIGAMLGALGAKLPPGRYSRTFLAEFHSTLRTVAAGRRASA